MVGLMSAKWQCTFCTEWIGCDNYLAHMKKKHFAEWDAKEAREGYVDEA